MRKETVVLFLIIASSLCGILPAQAQGPIPNLAFVADVTIPDDSAIAPGTHFAKVWRLQNNGPTEWSPGCALTFLKGDPLGAVDRVLLGRPVPTGETVELAVTMQAPDAPGRYTSWWQMRDELGRPFGPPVFVRIVVEGEAPRQEMVRGMRVIAAPESAYLVADNSYGVWAWSEPKGQHDEGDVLQPGAYPLLRKTIDGQWAEVQFGTRAVWVYVGVNSGTHEESRPVNPPRLAQRLPAAFIETPTLLEVAKQDPRRAVEIWKARIEWYEERNVPDALATNSVPGLEKGPGAIYRLIDEETSALMARLPYALIEPIFYIQHLGVCVPGRTPLGMPGPPVPLGVDALTDHMANVEIRYDFLAAPNPNFRMSPEWWPKIRAWALLATLAHEGRHIMAHTGENHEEAVAAQKQILLYGAQELRAQGDEPSAALLEQLAAVVRSGSGNLLPAGFGVPN